MWVSTLRQHVKASVWWVPNCLPVQWGIFFFTKSLQRVNCARVPDDNSQEPRSWRGKKPHLASLETLGFSWHSRKRTVFPRVDLASSSGNPQMDDVHKASQSPGWPQSVYTAHQCNTLPSSSLPEIQSNTPFKQMLRCHRTRRIYKWIQLADVTEVRWKTVKLLSLLYTR